MKAFKTIYKHGHFVDLESGKRLIPKQNMEFTITAEDGAFNEVDFKLVLQEPKSQEEKSSEIIGKYRSMEAFKILDKGTQLFFRIGNSKRIEGDESRQYIFLCTLLEDLYLFKIKDKSGEEVLHWRLVDCMCELDQCLLGDLEVTEKIRGKSLSNLFSRVVQLYFANQRTPSTNALTDFFLYHPGLDIEFSRASNHLYHSISEIRKEKVHELNDYKAPEEMEYETLLKPLN